VADRNKLFETKRQIQKWVEEDIQYLQRKALEYSEANDQAKLSEALKKQGEAIQTLLEFLATE